MCRIFFFPVLGYLKLMLLISMDAFISSLLITMHSHKTTIGHPPFALTRFLTTPIVTKVLALPKLDSLRTLVYDQSAQRPDAGHDTTTTLWDIVIVAFERIIFVVFFAITVAILRSVNISFSALFWSILTVIIVKYNGECVRGNNRCRYHVVTAVAYLWFPRA